MLISRLLTIAAIAVAAACSSSTGYGGNPPPPPPPPGPPPPPPPTLSVSVADNSFSPQNGTVASGGTVTWNWTGTHSHNVTFENSDTSATQISGTHQRTFPTVTTATTFRYRCTIHSSSFTSGTMIGQIVVTP